MLCAKKDHLLSGIYCDRHFYAADAVKSEEIGVENLARRQYLRNEIEEYPWFINHRPNLLKSMGNTFSVRLSRSVQSAIEAISLALYSVSHDLRRGKTHVEHHRMQER